jgi:twitching motility protein PilT
MEINELLQRAFAKGASDIHIRAGLRPVYRIDGELVQDEESDLVTPEIASRSQIM